MKKLVISLVAILLLVFSGFLVITGIKIGNFQILGISGIKSETQELDEKIQQAGKLAEKDFKQVVSDIETNAKKLIQEKQNYDNMITSIDGETTISGQIQKYEIEALWVMLGKHATSEGVVLQMDVIKSGTASDVYNLKFTVTGSYISIIDFISAIENDSALGFKIEEFKMVPGGSELQATFICKDITIKDISDSVSNNQNTEEQDAQDNASDNTNSINKNNSTNTVNANNTTNSINSTNTNNKQ